MVKEYTYDAETNRVVVKTIDEKVSYVTKEILELRKQQYEKMLAEINEQLAVFPAE
jgi:hypothetical protein